MSYYTSYETSVALRDAGAPQEGPARCWFGPTTGYNARKEPLLVDPYDDVPPNAYRAFRLDTILTALTEYARLQHEKDGHRWRVQHSGPYEVNGAPASAWEVCVDRYDDGDWETVENAIGDSPVEAAAACYLAVLRAAREARP